MKSLIKETEKFISQSSVNQNKEAVAQSLLLENKNLRTLENILDFKKEFGYSKGQVIRLFEYGINCGLI